MAAPTDPTVRADAGMYERRGEEIGGDDRSIAKFPDLRLCAPFAEFLRVKGKLALTIKQLVGDLAHARGIFEDHSIRTLEKRNRAEDVGRRPGPKTMGTCRTVLYVTVMTWLNATEKL